MRSALVGCCAAALALVAPGGVGAQVATPKGVARSSFFAHGIAEERLCRDTDILVCGNTGVESTMIDLITGIDYPGGTYATVRASNPNIAVDCPAPINSPLETWQCHPPPSAGAILPGIPPGAQVTVVDYKHFAANDPVGVASAGGLSFLTVAAKNATGPTEYYTYGVCDGSGYTGDVAIAQPAVWIETFSETGTVTVVDFITGGSTYIWVMTDNYPAGYCSPGWVHSASEDFLMLTYTYGPTSSATPTAGELAYAAVYGELFNYSSPDGETQASLRTTSPILGAVRHANNRDVQVTLQRNILNGGGGEELHLRTENQTTVTLDATSFADSFACTFAPASGADAPFDYFVAEPSKRVHTRVNNVITSTTKYYVTNLFNENTTYACTCVLPPSKQYTDSNKAEFEVCVIVAVTPDLPTMISFDRGLEFTFVSTMCGGTATAEAIAISSSSVLPDEYQGVRLSCIMPYTVPTFTNEADRKRRGDSGRPVANLASKRMEIDVFDDSEYYNGTFPNQQCKFDLQTAATFTEALEKRSQSGGVCFPAPLVVDPTDAEAKCGPANGADGCTLVSVAPAMGPPFVACACAPPPPPPRGRTGSASNSNSNSNSNAGIDIGVALVGVAGVGALAVGAAFVFSRTPKSSDVYMPLSQAVGKTRM